ncbi:hypothetical protein FRAHR75_320044 [Frankia sp. Hr75.2]|nr:hypothetical protein FRAHR75_320044 [Frankia sp. Hr75.2]
MQLFLHERAPTWIPLLRNLPRPRDDRINSNTTRSQGWIPISLPGRPPADRSGQKKIIVRNLTGNRDSTDAKFVISGYENRLRRRIRLRWRVVLQYAIGRPTNRRKETENEHSDPERNK